MKVLNNYFGKVNQRFMAALNAVIEANVDNFEVLEGVYVGSKRLPESFGFSRQVVVRQTISTITDNGFIRWQEYAVSLYSKNLEEIDDLTEAVEYCISTISGEEGIRFVDIVVGGTDLDNSWATSDKFPSDFEEWRLIVVEGCLATVSKEEPPVDQRPQWIVDSVTETVEAINAYIASKPEGPYDLETFETLIVTVDATVNIELTLEDNVLTVTGSIEGFNFTETQTVIVPEPVQPDPYEENSIFWFKLQNDFADTISGLNGSITGTAPIFVDSPVGKAAKFDGNGFVRIPPINKTFAEGFSYSLFIKWDEYGPYSSVNDFGIAPDSLNILFNPYSGSRLSFLSFTVNNNPSVIDLNYGVPHAGEWNMFTITVASNGYTTFYVNGVSTFWAYGNPIFGGDRVNCFLGAQTWNYNDTPGEWFKGEQAHVRMWDKVLTPEDVLGLYNYLS